MSSIEEFDHRFGKNNRLSKERSRSRIRCPHSRGRSSSSRDVIGSPRSRSPNLRDRRYSYQTRDHIVEKPRTAFSPTLPGESLGDNQRRSTEGVRHQDRAEENTDILRSRLLEQGNMSYNHDMEIIPLEITDSTRKGLSSDLGKHEAKIVNTQHNLKFESKSFKLECPELDDSLRRRLRHLDNASKQGQVELMLNSIQFKVLDIVKPILFLSTLTPPKRTTRLPKPYLQPLNCGR